jgi:hypothetical protein
MKGEKKREKEMHLTEKGNDEEERGSKVEKGKGKEERDDFGGKFKGRKGRGRGEVEK